MQGLEPSRSVVKGVVEINQKGSAGFELSYTRFDTSCCVWDVMQHPDRVAKISAAVGKGNAIDITQMEVAIVLTCKVLARNVERCGAWIDTVQCTDPGSHELRPSPAAATKIGRASC